jgi:hypothetical protein
MSVRISDDGTVKKALLGKPHGRRKSGRPKLRALNCNENYRKWVVVKRWRKM